MAKIASNEAEVTSSNLPSPSYAGMLKKKIDILFLKGLKKNTKKTSKKKKKNKSINNFTNTVPFRIKREERESLNLHIKACSVVITIIIS